jgi:hypothetical protein
MSGYADERLRDERRAITDAELLPKPFRTPQLLACVQRLLRSRIDRASSTELSSERGPT